ncbi:MAG: YihA family ribosome biogenesis GTP-binding protein [Bradymonadaceae bacterium]|nr:YihA family ribosome biogenesis GTP-binding protein [Lujinxingiaceae bacterium]
MKITKAEFVKAGTRPHHFPPETMPEVAFAGRSNVGKSSLINSLTRHSKLVKTSKTPGRTQTINFFNINDKLYFVDLPGYGFAKVPLAVKAAWGPMVEGYLKHRPNLRALICVMDIRRGVQEDDLQLIQSCPYYGIQPILVFTKADKLGRNAREQRKREIAVEMNTDPNDLLLYSSLDDIGQEEMWKRITDITSL